MNPPFTTGPFPDVVARSNPGPGRRVPEGGAVLARA
jgi:hypothetical protein